MKAREHERLVAADREGEVEDGDRDRAPRARARAPGRRSPASHERRAGEGDEQAGRPGSRGCTAPPAPRRARAGRESAASRAPRPKGTASRNATRPVQQPGTDRGGEPERRPQRARRRSGAGRAARRAPQRRPLPARAVRRGPSEGAERRVEDAVGEQVVARVPVVVPEREAVVGEEVGAKGRQPRGPGSAGSRSGRRRRAASATRVGASRMVRDEAGRKRPSLARWRSAPSTSAVRSIASGARSSASARTSPGSISPTSPRRWPSRCVLQLCRGHAWANALRAAYPGRRGLRARRRRRLPGRRRDERHCSRRAAATRSRSCSRSAASAGSSYPAIISSFAVLAPFDSGIGLLVLGYAITRGLLPAAPRLPELPAFDISFWAAHPQLLLFTITVVMIGLVVAGRRTSRAGSSRSGST